MSRKIFRRVEGSSQIDATNHDVPTSIMEIRFHNGSIYSYHPVTLKQYDDFIEAPSVGSHFYKNFKNNPLITATKIKNGNKN